MNSCFKRPKFEDDELDVNEPKLQDSGCFPFSFINWSTQSNRLSKRNLSKYPGHAPSAAVVIPQPLERAASTIPSQVSSTFENDECNETHASLKFDQTLNVMLALGRLTMDNWTPASSEIIQLSLQNPLLKQMEMAKILKKPQSNISVGLKRGGFDEMEQLLNYYRTEINKLC